MAKRRWFSIKGPPPPSTPDVELVKAKIAEQVAKLPLLGGLPTTGMLRTSDTLAFYEAAVEAWSRSKPLTAPRTVYTAVASRPHDMHALPCRACHEVIGGMLAAGASLTPTFEAWLKDQHDLSLMKGCSTTTTSAEPDGKDDDVSKSTDWNLIQRALESSAVRTAYFWGPPGIGKTYSAYHQGRLDRGLFAVTLTEETPAAELRGHFIPKGGEMVWMDGPVITAMRQGGRLVINEVTHASPDAWSFMLPILEGFGTARLTLPNGETVSPAEGFHCICTDNADPDSLPPALKDRFDVSVHVTTPHPAALELLPKPWRVPAVKLANIEEARRVSLRSWMALAKLIPVLGPADAAKAVFGEARSRQILEALMLREGKVVTDVAMIAEDLIGTEFAGVAERDLLPEKAEVA